MVIVGTIPMTGKPSARTAAATASFWSVWMSKNTRLGWVATFSFVANWCRRISLVRYIPSNRNVLRPSVNTRTSVRLLGR